MYEAPEVLSISEAHNLILGVKPWCGCLDSEGMLNYAERNMDDIDESDD